MRQGKRKMAFELDIDEREGVCEYNPLELRGLDRQTMPAFLAETINFELGQLPALHYKTLTALHAPAPAAAAAKQRPTYG
eukprot:SAG22_NODE_285_length_12974_cov_2.969087_9_plen_80_part_00